MSTELAASPRTEQGKGPSRRLRNAGNVPAVVYAAGKEPMALTVEPRALRKAIAGPLGRNTLLTLTLPGGKRTVLVKDVQLHPVKHEVIHADFIEVDVTKPVKIEVPVVLVGKNKNITAGGVVEQVSRRVQVKALAAAIPEKIEVDISELQMGESIHLSDLKMPNGLTLLGDLKRTVATVVAVREEKAVEKAAAVDATGAPAAAGAAGAPAAAGAAKAGAPAAGAAAAKPGAPAAAAPAKK
jgi:large subunit ribosomal protein L25